MTNDNPQHPGRSFARSYLPWLLGTVGLVIYLSTLNHWISSSNFRQVAWIGGYSWQTEVQNPLYYVATLPLRLVPTKLLPLALNLFSAVCAAITLVLLARSVVLLPHDRTQDQRDREKALGALLTGPLDWLPPTLAVLVCGLQLTFWQHATDATTEMIKLMFFAYIIRNLLEFRFEERESWLYKATFAYGLLMTNDWLIFGLVPVFIATLIWMRGLNFFDLRFLGRMLLFGFLGLLLYLLLPALAANSPVSPISFWQALKMNILMEKSTLFGVPKYFPNNVLLLLSLTSVVPVFVFSIRWASYFGDTSQLGVTLTKMIFHFVHLILLGISLWVMLDPRFSPRSVFPYISFLNLYFLSALSVGYFSGYFLVVFRPLPTRSRRPSKLPRLLHRLAIFITLCLSIAVPGVLVIRNLALVRAPSRNAVTDLARLTVESLPKSACLLADDPRRALLVRAWLAGIGRDKDYMVVETGALKLPAYHRYLQRLYGDKWPIKIDPQQKQRFEDTSLLDMINRLVKSNEVVYLHPSFGYFFERFYLEPHGLSYTLKSYQNNDLLPPPPSAETIKENNAFWDRAIDSELIPVLALTQPKPETPDKTVREHLFEQLHLADELPVETRQIGEIYSRSLNYWGVALQRIGDMEKAATYFDVAVKLFPENVMARANLAYNEKLRAGNPPPFEIIQSLEDRFGRAFGWDDALQSFGPFDEPSLCFAQGRTLVASTLYRQAAMAFDRAFKLSSNNIPSRLWLARIYSIVGSPDKALELVNEIAEHREQFRPDATNNAEIISVQASILFQKQESQRAESILESAVAAAPTDSYLLANVISVYNQNSRYSNALVNIGRQIKLNPDDATAWLNKGYVQLQMNDCTNAIAALNQCLTIETNALSDLHNRAQLNRALAYLRCDRIDEAKADFEVLQQQFPTAFQIYYNLGEIALRQNDTNLAIQHYQSYLSNAIPDLPETIMIQDRLKELKGGKPEKP